MSIFGLNVSLGVTYDKIWPLIDLITDLLMYVIREVMVTLTHSSIQKKCDFRIAILKEVKSG